MKINQIGRSMVEMLGVLAIVGVLSVGSIAGYSKAMNKYKLNKLKNQITQIVANIQTLYISTNKNSWSDKVVSKLVMLKEMGTSGANNCKHAMGGSCFIGINQSARKYMKVGIMDLSYENCLDIAVLDFSGIQYTILINSLNTPHYDNISKCTDEEKNNRCFKSNKQPTIEQIKEACGHDLNAVVWYFGNDLID